MAEPPPLMTWMLEVSASPEGTPAAAASTVGTLPSTVGLKRSTSLQIWRTAKGLRHPEADSTTREPPPTRVANAWVSAPPTWYSGMPKSVLRPGLPESIITFSAQA